MIYDTDSVTSSLTVHHAHQLPAHIQRENAHKNCDLEHKVEKHCRADVERERLDSWHGGGAAEKKSSRLGEGGEDETWGHLGQGSARELRDGYVLYAAVIGLGILLHLGLEEGGREGGT